MQRVLKIGCSFLLVFSVLVSLFIIPIFADNEFEKTDEIENVEITEESEVEYDPNKDTLDIIFYMGQSNAEGLVDEESYEQARNESIVCDENMIFSTVVPINAGGRLTTGCSFNNLCKLDNVTDFIPESLESNVSQSETELEYPLNSLSKNGNGKTGVDSAIAYQWNKLTGNAVWIINITYSGSKISSWVPGQEFYEIAVTAMDDVMNVFDTETGIDGNFNAGDVMMVWQQGESDVWGSTSVNTYKEQFVSMYEGYKEHAPITSCGFITIRATTDNCLNPKDIEYGSARTAQLELAEEYDDVYIASDANEVWVTDVGVTNYFSNNYPNGITYPTQSAKLTVPTTVEEVHPTVHYSQIGHNENGITCANGMYDVLVLGKDSGSTKDNYSIGSGTDVIHTVYNGTDGWYYTVNGIIDDTYTGFAKNEYGTWYITKGKVTFADNNCVLSGVIDSISGQWYVDGSKVQYNTNGLANKKASDGKWYYFVNGKVDTNPNVVQNNYGWWYVQDGYVRFSYNGFGTNSYGTWYIENGKVLFNKTGLIEGPTNGKGDDWYETVNSEVQHHTGVMNYCNEYGWWYVKDGKVDFSKNSIEQNDYGWWYVLGGKVTFNYTGVSNYPNDYGWWYIQDGKVNFGKTSIEPNQYGWWRVVDGKVDFICNSVEQNSYGWWYIRDGKVQFNYTGIVDYTNQYGWWYVKEGKVDFSKNSVEPNSWGWWYVNNGKVNFNYTGVSNYANDYGWWYLNGGKVDFGFTGRASNRYGTWNVVNGKVVF